MTEVLSQEDIEQLLTAINSGSDGEIEDFSNPVNDNRKIKIYDFKRPDNSFVLFQICTKLLLV